MVNVQLQFLVSCGQRYDHRPCFVFVKLVLPASPLFSYGIVGQKEIQLHHGSANPC